MVVLRPYITNTVIEIRTTNPGRSMCWSVQTSKGREEVLDRIRRHAHKGEKVKILVKRDGKTCSKTVRLPEEDPMGRVKSILRGSVKDVKATRYNLFVINERSREPDSKMFTFNSGRGFEEMYDIISRIIGLTVKHENEKNIFFDDIIRTRTHSWQLRGRGRRKGGSFRLDGYSSEEIIEKVKENAKEVKRSWKVVGE